MPSLSPSQIRARANYDARAEYGVLSGALSLLCRTSFLAISGTVAYSLANGLWDGQEKEIYTQSAASTPVATVVVTSMTSGTTIAGFGTIGATAYKSVVLKWNAFLGKWYPKASVGVTFSA